MFHLTWSIFFNIRGKQVVFFSFFKKQFRKKMNKRRFQAPFYFEMVLSYMESPVAYLVVLRL